MPGPQVEYQREGESHIRYKNATDDLIRRAPNEQERAILQTMVVQDFLQSRDETDTSLSLWRVMNGGNPWGFIHNGKLFQIQLSATKGLGRSKAFILSIGRPPEQSDLADCLRALNFTFKLLESVSLKRLASLEYIVSSYR
eukprot:scaffold4087_cov153-Skeletonema_marinoi.AAC.8